VHVRTGKHRDGHPALELRAFLGVGGQLHFLVDPFAAIPAFLVITAGADRKRQQRMARRGALTCLIVLMTFALAGKLIFRMFGITLPAFEIAGGVILLLIGIDMVEARRSPTQESSDETAEATSKDDAGIMGLLLVALAVQFFINGLTDLGVIGKLQ
jgi:multiple antibiotic resistance protein